MKEKRGKRKDKKKTFFFFKSQPLVPFTLVIDGKFTFNWET